jgi:hypothetical protein
LIEASKWLTKFLGRIEQFFGDAGIADRTLFPDVLGLKKPGTAVGGSRLRPLSIARPDLSDRNSLSHLGDQKLDKLPC